MFKYTDPSLWGEVYLNMNSGVLELKLHKVHFADKYSQVHVQVDLSSQAWIGVLEHELRCTWTWVCEVLPLFRRTSYKYMNLGIWYKLSWEPKIYQWTLDLVFNSSINIYLSIVNLIKQQQKGAKCYEKLIQGKQSLLPSL